MKRRAVPTASEKHKAIQGVEGDFWRETENENCLSDYPRRAGTMAISILSLTAVSTSAN